jgi:hypothetical protein
LVAGPDAHPTGTFDAVRQLNEAARFVVVPSSRRPRLSDAMLLTGSENVTTSDPVSVVGVTSVDVGGVVSAASASAAGTIAAIKASRKTSGRARFTR